LLSLVSRPYGGLDTKDDLVHQLIDAGEQERSSILLTFPYDDFHLYP
jgi:hypothetical protein